MNIEPVENLDFKDWKNHSELVNECLEYLLIRHVPAWKNNSGAYRVGKRFIKFGFPGSADILGLIPPTGRMLAIECKVRYDKLSELQEQFLTAIKEAGGIAVTARTLGDIEEAIR